MTSSTIAAASWRAAVAWSILMPPSPSSPAVEPALSVVVALVGPGPKHGGERLAAWSSQLASSDQLLVITDDPKAAAELALEPAFSIVDEGRRGVPELWARGMDSAEAPWVLTTIADVEIPSGFVSGLRQILAETPAAAVGVRIAPPPDDHAAHVHALYLLRYADHLRPGPTVEVEDLAADLAVYRRDLLLRHRAVWIDGFWEPELHRRLLAEGERLHWHRELAVRLADSPDPASFIAQRFHHGRHYGANRARGMSFIERLARLLSVPLLPPLFLLRTLLRAGPGLATRWAFLRAVPFFLVFATAWALGEGRGYQSPLEAREGRS